MVFATLVLRRHANRPVQRNGWFVGTIRLHLGLFNNPFGNFEVARGRFGTATNKVRKFGSESEATSNSALWMADGKVASETLSTNDSVGYTKASYKWHFNLPPTLQRHRCLRACRSF